MPITLYVALVPTFQQVLGGVAALVGKVETHAAEQGWAEAETIDSRLAPDMLPFGYQVMSAIHHSLGAIEATKRGTFSPDRSQWPVDFAGLKAALDSALAGLAALDPAGIDDLVGKDAAFVMGERRMDFLAEDFLLSFSQPNFFFHATTAYDIARMKGVPLGKKDFIHRPRLKA